MIGTRQTQNRNYEDNGFYIIEEFAALSANRKIQLCNVASSGNHQSFEHAVHMIWPHASEQDVRKLESFALLVCGTKSGLY